MEEPFEYIDRYFNGELSVTEKKAFEDRCEADPSFASEVALYIQLRAGVKTVLHDEKKKEFSTWKDQLSSQESQTGGRVRKMFPYIAAAIAACLILFICWQYFLQTSSPRDLAEKYVDQNLQTLSIPMGSAKDSLDRGVAAFNNKKYDEASSIFLPLSPHNADAMKYLGITNLVTGKYEEAIRQFQTLSKNSDLFANPGLFYEAVALMRRDANNDKAEAKKILQQVIDQDLPGKKEAQEWIGKL